MKSSTLRCDNPRLVTHTTKLEMDCHFIRDEPTSDSAFQIAVYFVLHPRGSPKKETRSLAYVRRWAIPIWHTRGAALVVGWLLSGIGLEVALIRIIS